MRLPKQNLRSKQQNPGSRKIGQFLSYWGMNGENSYETECPSLLCPLNQIRAGMAVRIKQLCAAPELRDRLREIGFCEERVIKLLTSQGNIICLLCNTRMALSEQMARAILVEPVRQRVAS